MKTKNKIYLLRIAILTFLLPLMSCEKEMMDYEGAEGIYFAVQYGPSYGNERVWPYQPSSDIEFVKIPANETIYQVKVMITGAVKDYDREFKVEINPDSTTAVLGVHYKALPGGLIIPANAISATVPVTLIRTPDLETAVKMIGLRLVANEHFKLSFPEWDAIPGYTSSSTPIVQEFDASLHTIRVNDFMVKPAVWIGSIQAENRESGQWGAFSRKKIELMFKLLDLTYADFSSTTTMPSVRSGLVASECARYLIERFNAGDPVLEDDGRLMFIGNVPWTSYIGVPWKR